MAWDIVEDHKHNAAADKGTVGLLANNSVARGSYALKTFEPAVDRAQQNALALMAGSETEVFPELQVHNAEEHAVFLVRFQSLGEKMCFHAHFHKYRLSHSIFAGSCMFV